MLVRFSTFETLHIINKLHLHALNEVKFQFMTAPAVNFWLKLATEQGLYTNVYWFTDGYPIVVIKWPGLNSTLGSIMLNSHMDVVPADENVRKQYYLILPTKLI